MHVNPIHLYASCSLSPYAPSLHFTRISRLQFTTLMQQIMRITDSAESRSRSFSIRLICHCLAFVYQIRLVLLDRIPSMRLFTLLFFLHGLESRQAELWNKVFVGYCFR